VHAMKIKLKYPLLELPSIIISSSQIVIAILMLWSLLFNNAKFPHGANLIELFDVLWLVNFLVLSAIATLNVMRRELSTDAYTFAGFTVICALLYVVILFG
jgi:hypothetical protein